MNDVLVAVLTLGGLGLLFGGLIATANKRFWVWEDPRVDVVSQMLPNANCGACGLPGCRAFAEQAVQGKITPAQCTVAAEEVRQQIASYLGVDAGEAVKNVARLLCAGSFDVAGYQAEYRGLPTCAAAAAVAGGGKGCVWGCLGLGDCERVCEFDAISMNETGLPVVDVEKCTACGDCVDACPKSLFELRPLSAGLLVQCRNLVAGDEVLEDCMVACTACAKCVKDAAEGLISVASGVAVIDYDRIALAEPRATERCPTGAIVWLAGAQFTHEPLAARQLQ